MLDALDVINALKEFEDERIKNIQHHLLESAVGRSSNLMFSFFQYGKPDEMDKVHNNCKLGCALSLVPGEKLEDIKRIIEGKISFIVQKSDWMKKNIPELKWISGVSGAETDSDSLIFKMTKNIFNKYGAKPRINPLHTSSDIRNPIVQKNIPTIGFGPKCGNLSMCNEANEWIDLEDYLNTLCVTTEIISKFCNEK